MTDHTGDRPMQRRSLRTWLVVTMLSLAPTAVLRAQAPDSATIVIGGAVPTPRTLHPSDLVTLKRLTVQASDHGKVGTYEGVSLVDLLGLAGVSSSEGLRGKALAEVVLVEARDGYHAVFSRAELDSTFRVRQVLVVDKADGKPLDATTGPFRLVVPDEARPARWVRQLTAIYVVPVAPPVN
jgi:hypothetical protein